MKNGTIAPRIGIIGASARRQGLGPYIARFLSEEGAAVTGVVASSLASASAAAEHYRARYGLEVEPCADAGALFAQGLDAVVIASPHATHEPYLQAALEADLHVLCEKPMLWDCPQPVERARALLEAFRARGRLLMVNCQWPATLEGFRAVHPGALDVPPKTFSMRLSPACDGLKRIPDCLPHPLSLLQTLAGEGELCDIRIEGAGPRLDIAFGYRCASGTVATTVRLERCDLPPRPAGYAIDGRAVRRHVELPDYAIFFENPDEPGARVRLTDPLRLLLRTFLSGLRGEAIPTIPDPARRLAHLHALSAAYQSQIQGSMT